jgi:hypothetical protein
LSMTQAQVELLVMDLIILCTLVQVWKGENRPVVHDPGTGGDASDGSDYSLHSCLGVKGRELACCPWPRHRRRFWWRARLWSVTLVQVWKGENRPVVHDPGTDGGGSDGPNYYLNSCLGVKGREQACCPWPRHRWRCWLWAWLFSALLFRCERERTGLLSITQAQTEILVKGQIMICYSCSGVKGREQACCPWPRHRWRW